MKYHKIIKVCLVLLFATSLLSCNGRNIRNGDNLSNGNSSNQDSDSIGKKNQFVLGKTIQVGGLKKLQNVYLSFTDSNDEVIGLLSTNYNNSVSLDSLKLVEGREYFVKAYSEGYEVGAPKKITPMKNSTDIITTFSFEKIEDNLYRYHWENDFKNSEYEYSSKVPEINNVKFLNNVVKIQNLSSSVILRDKYKILLSDEDQAWSLDYSSKLLKTIAKIPHNELSLSKFVLTSREINDDILIQTQNNQKIITISQKAFTGAESRLVTLDGVRGKYFSKRLHHGLVRFITNNGEDIEAVEKILQDSFGVELSVPDMNALTGENAESFQDFHANELVDIISAFSEMPSGFNKVAGLKYLLRRKNGHPHPTHPQAPAVAWPRGANNDSYIEFMESAFRNGGPGVLSHLAPDEYLHRLIIHEKTHFIYHNTISEKIVNDWITIAGWFENANDKDGWSNRFNNSFVSPYAHLKNPSEDFSESVSYYIINPSKLKTVAPQKYDFILKKIMNGAKYKAEVREDLRFEVLNLFPDYDYPGKIKSVDVEARGSKSADKEVQVEINLLDKAQFDDGAVKASMRITSSVGTYLDLNLTPVDGDEHRLRGSLTIPKNAKAGYWLTDQIVIEDAVGNLRMEGVEDFGFSLYINNQIEDIKAPEYVPGSLSIDITPDLLSAKAVHKVEVKWKVEEDIEIKSDNGAYIKFNSLDHKDTYSLQVYGDIDPITLEANVTFYITNYFPSGRYTVSHLKMTDSALNFGEQYFSDSSEHEREVVATINTNNHDTINPTLDINRINIVASPTNLTKPDGQTKVTISYYAKDDKSGLGSVNYALIDPTGKKLSEYHYHENFYTDFFEGDATVYKKYTIHHVLPRGSAPGIWGLQEMVLSDKGGNSKNFNFTEIFHFEVED